MFLVRGMKGCITSIRPRDMPIAKNLNNRWHTESLDVSPSPSVMRLVSSKSGCQRIDKSLSHTYQWYISSSSSWLVTTIHDISTQRPSCSIIVWLTVMWNDGIAFLGSVNSLYCFMSNEALAGLRALLIFDGVKKYFNSNRRRNNEKFYSYTCKICSVMQIRSK